MKVLLISANAFTRPYAVYPLGLDYVAGALADRHTVEIVDVNALPETAELERRIRSFDPDLVGISLRNVDTSDHTDPTGFFEPYRRLVLRVRNATDATLVLGGSAFTLFPDAFLQALEADFGILGEGERINLLIDALEGGSDPESVPGVIAPGRRRSVPTPWTGLRRRMICGPDTHAGFYLRRGGMLNLQSKRGCPFQCVYCTYPYIEGRRFRRFDPEEVAKTALHLQKTGARYLFIADATFNTDIDHSLAVAEAMAGAGVSIPWGAFFAPMRHPDDYFQRMAAAGLTHVEFGTESLSSPVLAAYKKPFTPAEVFAAHEAALEAGLYVAHYFLLGGPGETGETVAETLSGAGSLSQTVLFFFCGMRIYPHTPLAALAEAEGVISPDQDLLFPVFYRSPRLDPDAVLKRLTEAARGRGNWIVGAGGDQAASILDRMHRRGKTGPLWEFLIPPPGKG